VNAGPGYDAITGRGSPYADRVVSGLVGGGTVNLPPALPPAPTPAPTPTPPAPKPAPPPAPPTINKGLNLGFIANRVANFFQKTTGSGVPSLAAATRPAVRLPSEGATFLASPMWGADMVRALATRRPEGGG
jgi:hypothetical protein